ncbi:MAG: sel1 repeat family protein [Desulfobulbaceae bacterium]|nr:sel1 repeat family protein [Desulfobulbaceae bacterium]
MLRKFKHENWVFMQGLTLIWVVGFLNLAMVAPVKGAGLVKVSSALVNATMTSAKAGDGEAQYKLAKFYEEGSGVPKSISKAVKWYRLAATQGHVDAQYKFVTALDGNPEASFLIGKMYQDGAGVEENIPKAVKFFKQAAAKDHVEAQYLLGAMYAYGEGVKQDDDEAISLWTKAAARGHLKAKTDLEKIFNIRVAAVTGSDTVVDRGKVEAIIKSAESGDANAQYDLAQLYEEGIEVPQSVVKALKWYQKAAAQGHIEARYEFSIALSEGHPEAVFLMGKMYQDGTGGVQKDILGALKRFRQAAEQGHAEAQYVLGSIYAGGEGVEPDNVESIRWLKMAAAQNHMQAKEALERATVLKSAEAGDAKAQYKLAKFYEQGTGVPQSMTKAFTWYKNAASQSHVEAQFKTAGNYALGTGTAKSLAEAVKWYRMAAKQGHLAAQYELGFIYETGAGVKRDYGIAVKLYAEVASKGNAGAQYRLGLLKNCGKGTRKSYSEAVKWWGAASQKGNSMATFFLGYMYETGSGVKRDMGKAKKYYSQSAKKGNVFAKQTMRSLSN